MAKKASEAAGKTVETKEETGSGNASGFYMYIGPNLKRLLQTGTIFRGTREEALAKAAEAVVAHPLVKTLIVSGDALSLALVKVKKPGNVLYANYQKVKTDFAAAGKGGK